VGASTIYRYNPSFGQFYFFNSIPFGLPDGTALPPECAALGQVYLKTEMDRALFAR